MVKNHHAGVRNGAVSSPANALNLFLGIVLEVIDYKEHVRHWRRKGSQSRNLQRMHREWQWATKEYGGSVSTEMWSKHLSWQLLSAASSITDRPSGSTS
jgi:hypothetical protein